MAVKKQVSNCLIFVKKQHCLLPVQLRLARLSFVRIIPLLIGRDVLTLTIKKIIQEEFNVIPAREHQKVLFFIVVLFFTLCELLLRILKPLTPA
jgi:hypothetical protein